MEEVEARLLDAARRLSDRRRHAAAFLGERMTAELASLCMEGARFEVAFPDDEKAELERIRASGMDSPEFLFSANPGESPRSLARVASGGELSRLMLAMKCLLARRDRTETVIFDEIDAGISGRAAEAVGEKIAELAGHHQVLCITHMPQIAARADHHFLVEKKVDGGRTRTGIRKLSGEEHAGRLAHMLDGEAVTARTLAYVEELLNRTRKPKESSEQ